MALLVRVTEETGNKGGCWAWLRLGLHHLAAHSYEKAVKALQCAVQIRPSDCVCYECLGDAYLARGSYNAALRAYTKAQSLSKDDALYSEGQIAYIKNLTGDLFGSISDYENVLSKNPPKAVRLVSLVGLAEVFLTRARKYKQEQLLTNLKHDCLDAMQCLSKVIVEHPNNVTVWKLLGDACCLQSCLPASLSEFKVPANLIGNLDENIEETVTLDKIELLQLGGRCLGVCLKISETDAQVWHDLGVNIYLMVRAMCPDAVQLTEDGLASCKRALTCLKKSLALDTGSANAWNSLGVVAFSLGDCALAQHAFLRSLKISATAQAWCHLATLYLVNNNTDLAHETYSQAQAVDPAFVNCWVGQALVAEAIGHNDAFNLFRHSTVLGIHTESCIGYAGYVMQMACDPTGLTNISDAGPLIPSASDSLIFYTREQELDIVALNMLGLAFEILGLKTSALDTFSRAIGLCRENSGCSPSLIDAIGTNYCRALTTEGRMEEAIKGYSFIKEIDFRTQCGLALANLKAKDYGAAFECYTVAFYSLAPNDTQKGHIMVAMAFLQYKFKKIEDTKTLLFQSSCSDGVSVEGLAALAAVGLLEKDVTLSAAALAELEPHQNNPEYAHRITFLKAAQEISKGRFNEAKLILSRAVHCHPQLAPLWRSLSHVLLTAAQNSLPDSHKTSLGAVAAAAAARAISQITGETENVHQDVVMEALAWVKSSRLTSQRTKTSKTSIKEEERLRKRRALVEAQKAVHMCPGQAQTWAVLVAALEKNKLASIIAGAWATRSSIELSDWFKSVCR